MNRQHSYTKAARTADQGDTIRFLESGAGRGTRAHRIDTHGALIFLIEGHAFKIKRAVKYDYMDLSTVEKRHALLVREYDLNKPAAPSIYKGVIPIVRRQDGTLALDGAGEVQEWVLVMTRFPAEDELCRIAETRGIDDDLAWKLGAAIARYHAATPRRDLDAATLIAEVIDELERVFGSSGDANGGMADAFIARSRKLCSDCAGTLNQRSPKGCVRRCHGDLHLRNIVLIDGIPTPFDALEFDERLGTCDLLYDLAFLLMDLDHLGMKPAANRVLNAYLSDTAAPLEDAGLALLPLYLSVRAAIRAMVEMQTAAVMTNHMALRGEARTYLRQALAYLDPPRPVLVAFGGYSGTGKTTIARAILSEVGAAPGAIHVRSDVARKIMLHRAPLDRLGPEGYRPEVTARTYATIHQQARAVLEQGHSVVVDAVHGTPALRRAVEDVAAAAGCDFVGIWLEAATGTRTSRVATRGPDASDADAKVVAQQAVADPGPIHWHRIDTDQPLGAVILSASTVLKRQAVVAAQTSGGSHVG